MPADGAHFAVNALPAVLRGGGDIASHRFVLELRRRDQTLSATVTARPEDLTGVTYEDPDGSHRICYHTEVADLTVRLTDQSVQRVADLEHRGATAFEYASTQPLPGLPPRL